MTPTTMPSCQNFYTVFGPLELEEMPAWLAHGAGTLDTWTSLLPLPGFALWALELGFVREACVLGTDITPAHGPVPDVG